MLLSFTYISKFGSLRFITRPLLFVKVVVYSSGLLEEQEKFDNKVVDLFSYKTYEGLSAGTGHSYFGDVDYTLTYSTENIPHDFSSCAESFLLY